MTVEDLARFLDKIQLCANGCWEWQASRTNKGYGLFRFAGKNRVAHRVAYVSFVGPVPEGLQLDHLCRNRACVNPAHLEPVTRKENILRGMCPTARNARKTHCPKGHPYDGENTIIDSRGNRACRICKNAWQQAWKRRNRAQQSAYERERNRSRKEHAR